MAKEWIMMPARCQECNAPVQMYIEDARPHNPLVSDLEPTTLARCAKYNGKGKKIGCGWTGMQQDTKFRYAPGRLE
jgi:hypothetical protein